MEGTLGMDYSSDRRIYTLSNGNTEALVVDTFVCISHINAGVAKIFFMHCRYFSLQIRQSWVFGPFLCDMWTSSDVLCCTASILHLLAIALDRSDRDPINII